MYEEIVTKAVIGKGKKLFGNKYEFTSIDKIDAVLGCYIMNNIVSASVEKDNVNIKGSFDVNIWYSFDNNTKTKVEVDKIEYNETIKVDLKDKNLVNDSEEVIISFNKKPTVIDASSNDNKVTYEIEKEIVAEIVGTTKVKIQKVDIVKEDNDIDINENYLG